jgi:hypothetical protein
MATEISGYHVPIEDNPTKALASGASLDADTQSVQGIKAFNPPGSVRGGRMVFASVAAALAFAPAACATQTEVAPPEMPTTTASAEPSPVPESSSRLLKVDTVLPEELPAAVAAKVGSAVKVGFRQEQEEWQLPDGTFAGSTAVGGSMGSGVYVGGGEVLTAGHVLDENREFACGDYNVTGRGPDGKGIRRAQIEGETTTYRSDDHADAYMVPDFGMMHVPTESFADVPAAEIRTEPLKVGEPVYAVNYQPTLDGEDRNPTSASPLNEPAIFGGIVVLTESTNSQLVHVATGIMNYGAVEDENTRAGGSGGGWFDTDGKLVGVHSRSGGEDETMIPELAFGVDLPYARVNSSMIQPIRADMLEAARQELSEDAPCPRTEPKIVIVE